MRKAMILALAVLMIFTFCACERADGQPGSGGGESVSGDSRSIPEGGEENYLALADSVDQLTWQLYDRMDQKSNFVYSPYSIETMLMMADAGAAGDTRVQLEKALGISDIDKLLGEYARVKDELGEVDEPESDDGQESDDDDWDWEDADDDRDQDGDQADDSDQAEFESAASIWIDQTFFGENKVKKEYLETVDERIDGDVRKADFQNDLPGTKNRIQAWVNRQTDGLISDYQSIADRSTVCDLMSAVAFQGKWQYPFRASDTQKKDFYGLSGTRSVEMMHQSALTLRYYEWNGFRGIELPYRGTNVVMDIVLPEDEEEKEIGKKWSAFDGKKAFLSELDQGKGADISVLELPRFTEDFLDQELKGRLIDMGIRDAWTDRADFSGISDGGIYFSAVSHRARIQVDELGTKAAAVTEGAIVKSGVPADDGVQFVADHPFLYILRDKSTGMILFVGLYNDGK